MSSSSSLRSPLTGRGSAFSRKVAAKIHSLIERFESLTSASSSSSSSSSSSPEAPHSAESSCTDRVSPLRRWGESFLERITLFAEQNLTAIPQDEPTGVGLSSGLSATGNSQYTHGDCGYDGYGSTVESHSTIIGTDAGSASSRSTPVVPSSFFRQLLQASEKKFGVGIRKVYGRKKSTSPRMSVHGLRGNVERVGVVEEEGSFCVIRREELKLRKEERGLSGGMPRGYLNWSEADDGWVDEDDSSYDMPMEREHMAYTSSSEYRDAPLNCRDKRYLNTRFEYYSDGSLSSFGYLLRRLELVAGSSRPDSKASTTSAGRTFFTAPESTGRKVYQKTPPPHEFFSPVQRRVPDMPGMERRLEEDYSERSEILCPEPLNAVRSAELRGFAFKYT